MIKTCLYWISNWCWLSPAQLFSGPSPAWLVTKYYFLRIETPSTSRARSPYLLTPRTGWSSYSPRPWVLFSSRLAIYIGKRNSNPLPHQLDSAIHWLVLLVFQHGPHRKHRSSVEMQLLPWKHAFFFAEPLLRNSSFIVAYFAVVAQQR
jgi:hypothetical protein